MEHVKGMERHLARGFIFIQMYIGKTIYKPIENHIKETIKVDESLSLIWVSSGFLMYLNIVFFELSHSSMKCFLLKNNSGH